MQQIMLYSLLEKATGKTKTELQDMSLAEVESLPENPLFKKYKVKKPRYIDARGSVLVFLKRYINMKSVESYLAKIK